eukprot:Nitzschia sp. Nitz4//scaffold60_size111251//66169//66555//NITZ4_004152-RA/size111251-processed-gene-0.13-mRNA-1//1//CDS//3329555579//7873//frame0
MNLLVLWTALVAMLSCSVDAFTTTPKESRYVIIPVQVSPETMNNGRSTGIPNSMSTTNTPSSSSTMASISSPRFALPPSKAAEAAQRVVQYHHIQAALAEEEDHVPLGLALVSCVLSAALGFSLGYGT